MGAKMFLFSVFLDYQIDKVYGVSAVGAISILQYFPKCEIKNTGLIHCFGSLQVIPTGLLNGCP